jgi:ectoine hydroxylase-related dioxygenase (phytanoyl-CoA dioxygenase family)
MKAGVAHVEAPEEVLQAMLTARIHLDDVTEENGPLRLIPGSHRSGKTLRFDPGASKSILAAEGDVLLMRPLVVHQSGNSHPGTRRHRCVFHLEFTASPVLPDRFAWQDFIR